MRLTQNYFIMLVGANSVFWFKYFQNEIIITSVFIKNISEMYKILLLSYLISKYINPDISQEFINLHDVYIGGDVKNINKLINKNLKINFYTRCH